MQEHITTPERAQKLVPPVFASVNQNSVLPDDVLAAIPSFVVESGNFYRRAPEYKQFYLVTKRAIDIIVSISLIAILLPVFVVVALLVKTTSRGPVLFKHRRIGQYGEEFDCWKFRTMVTDAEEILKRDPNLQKLFDEKFKIDDDPRVTKLGKFLRSSSLDELPQLVQVLQGKLSLIGPRPIVQRELKKYSIYKAKLLSIQPGVSGLWQTSGRSKTSYAERVLLDMKYIDHRSLRLDITLMLMTVLTVLKKTGAR